MKKSFIKTFATLLIGMAIGASTLAAAAPQTVQGVLTKFNVVVNGEKQELKNTPVVIKGSTYLPVREVAGLLDADLVFDSKTQKIELSTKGDTTVTETITNPSVNVPQELTFREAVEILNKKYPDSNVTLGADGTLSIGENNYKLEYKKGVGNYTINPQTLIDLGLLTQNDF